MTSPDGPTDQGKGADPPRACILRLLALSAAAWDGDQTAASQLRFAGELLDLAGGARALADAQGQAKDFQLTTGFARRDLAGHIGSYWEHIPSWAAL